jgi:aspartate carbamoyltransferase catalytic subunit
MRSVVGLAFLETSLRTRVGFAAAAARLGATSVEVLDVRQSTTSMPESVEDTMRTLAGYVDVLVARLGVPLEVPAGARIPVLNAGDSGPRAEHPSQALIDLLALRKLPVPLEAQTVALCGDMRMRAARSLLLLLNRTTPKRLVLLTESRLEDGFELPPALAEMVEFRTLDHLDDVDVLYVVGIPHGALDESGRTRLRVTVEHLDALPAHARVLSPLPLIDEMERPAFTHPSVRMFEQSEDGLFVRMALLELLLRGRLEA